MTFLDNIKTGPSVTFKVDTTGFAAAIAEARRAMASFVRSMRLSTRIPHQPPPIAGGRGPAYRARARRRTRSHR